MENEVKTKVCKKCGQELPLDQFYTSVNCKDGHLNVCMEVKNGIIIDGVLHELVRQESNDCKGCSLYYTCHTYRFTYDKLCERDYL